MNPLEKPESERLKDLRDLRDKGFQPWALVLFDENNKPKLGELVSYPFPTKTGYSINMRTDIGDPTSMIEIAVSDIWTAEELAEMTTAQSIADFLKLISPIIRKRGSC